MREDEVEMSNQADIQAARPRGLLQSPSSASQKATSGKIQPLPQLYP